MMGLAEKGIGYRSDTSLEEWLSTSSSSSVELS